MQTELWESERQRSAALEKEVTALTEQLRASALGRRMGPPPGGGDAGGSGMGALGVAFANARGGPPGSQRDMEVANVSRSVSTLSFVVVRHEMHASELESG